MIYILGALTGILIGAVIALLKDRLLWGRLQGKEATDVNTGMVLAVSTISFAVNVLTLLVVFMGRNLFPEGMWVPCIVAVAVVLSILGPLLAARRNKAGVHTPESPKK